MKHLALLGALGFGASKQRIGIIGIPPDELSNNLKFSQRQIQSEASSDGCFKWVYPHTLYCSKKRNPLNGMTPDVLIALYGGPGTVQETEEALKAKRKIILLKPSDPLDKFLSTNPGDVYGVDSEKESVERALEYVQRGEFPQGYLDLSAKFCLEARKQIDGLRQWVTGND